MQFYGIGDFRGFWDNVSVKEVNPIGSAFSSRLVNSDYTGYGPMRIRNNDDQVEAELGWDSNNEISLDSPVKATSMNLLGFSEDFGEWTLNGNSRAKAVEDGFQCWKVTGGSGLTGVYYNVSLTASKSYTISAYVKQDTSDYVILRFGSPTSKDAKFTFSTEQFSEIDSGVLTHSAVKEGNWYRLAITLASQPSTASTGIAFYPDRDWETVLLKK